MNEPKNGGEFLRDSGSFNWLLNRTSTSFASSCLLTRALCVSIDIGGMTSEAHWSD
jgi:hypothetical protein